MVVILAGFPVCPMLLLWHVVRRRWLYVISVQGVAADGGHAALFNCSPSPPSLSTFHHARSVSCHFTVFRSCSC
ncbi:hypothetical protein GGX14DRAFT_204430 [Mycena pura]|uniref:Uncharacterized protein n=1 Tax=Mycena pura TaxID=153505 RepID=A0AAD6VSW5_9AGAR|nr:hypothetical protein GGX14DRAFT_204430 [Mycena pura]